jgi:hypothetical protein
MSWTTFRQFTDLAQIDSNEIFGTYTRSTGFNGEELVLFSDGKFYYRFWCDIYDPADTSGLVGSFSVDRNSITLKLSSMGYLDKRNNEIITVPSDSTNISFISWGSSSFKTWDNLYGKCFFVRKGLDIFIVAPLFTSLDEPSDRFFLVKITSEGYKYSEHCFLKTKACFK